MNGEKKWLVEGEKKKKHWENKFVEKTMEVIEKFRIVAWWRWTTESWVYLQGTKDGAVS